MYKKFLLLLVATDIILVLLDAILIVEVFFK